MFLNKDAISSCLLLNLVKTNAASEIFTYQPSYRMQQSIKIMQLAESGKIGRPRV